MTGLIASLDSSFYFDTGLAKTAVSVGSCRITVHCEIHNKQAIVQ